MTDEVISPTFIDCRILITIGEASRGGENKLQFRLLIPVRIFSFEEIFKSIVTSSYCSGLS